MMKYILGGAVAAGALVATMTVASAADPYTFALVPKNTNNPFFDQALAGCQKAEKELKDAKGAAIANAEKRLHAAIDAHEKDIERHAQEATAKLLEIESSAKRKVEELKKKYEAAAGQAKHALEAEWLGAERTVKRVEEVLATNELAAAEHKLAAASKRIGAEAAQLKARAQAAYQAPSQAIARELAAGVADSREGADPSRFSSVALHWLLGLIALAAGDTTRAVAGAVARGRAVGRVPSGSQNGRSVNWGPPAHVAYRQTRSPRTSGGSPAPDTASRPAAKPEGARRPS